MIEGESDFVSEEEMIRAIEVGHNAVKELCAGEVFFGRGKGRGDANALALLPFRRTR